MTSLYVREAHHEVLPARDLRLEPRARFVEYQEDLHRISGASLDRASLTRGDQYTFTHLADTLLERTGAETVWRAETTVAPSGTISSACWAADPCQTPSERVALPLTAAASGTVQSTRIWPGRMTSRRLLRFSD